MTPSLSPTPEVNETVRLAEPAAQSVWHRNRECRTVIYTRPGPLGPNVIYTDDNDEWWWANWTDWTAWVANAKEISDDRGEPIQ